MNFADLRFWAILFTCLTVLLGLRPFSPRKLRETYDKIALVSLGLVLLLFTSWLSFVIFMVVAIGTYWGLYLIIRMEAGQRRFLAILIPLQLAPLMYYKYADFIINRVAGWAWTGVFPALIPVGISFYTFQKVAFVVDTLVFREPLPKFLDYMNFAGFFPQIVAGPIERRKDLMPQMEVFRLHWSAEAFEDGVRWIILGLFFKCCLADNFTALFDGSSESNPYLIWLANFVFGLRIYYDFAGYSLVALGLGRCIGVRLTLNFASPYTSTSIPEFWRRWHITLSQWFRDYLYIPLGGGRVKWWAANVMLVFAVSGIWHGAGWNFLIWGLIHGTVLVVYRLFGRNLSKLPNVVGWAFTIIIAAAAWLCFYETRTGVLFSKLRTLFRPAAYNAAAFRAALHHLTGDPNIILLGGMTLLASVVLWAEWRSITKHSEPYILLRQPYILAALVALTILIAPGQTNGFIYFAF